MKRKRLAALRTSRVISEILEGTNGKKVQNEEEKKR
jgi:hypothetical protein